MHGGLGFVTPEGLVTQIREAFLIFIHLGEKSEKNHKNEAFSTMKLSPHTGEHFNCAQGPIKKITGGRPYSCTVEKSLNN